MSLYNVQMRQIRGAEFYYAIYVYTMKRCRLFAFPENATYNGKKTLEFG